MTDPEGWIPHDGDGMPHTENVLVDVKFRDGCVCSATRIGAWYWRQHGKMGDIVAWRPHKNADRQAGQSSSTAPSQEGHAAGPACSAPDGQIVAIVDLIRKLEGSAANTDTDWRWKAATALRECENWQTAKIVLGFPACEKCGMDLVLGCHICSAGWPTKLDVIRQAVEDALKPDEALIEKIGAEIDEEWEHRKVWSPASAARKAIREYLRRVAGKEKG